MTSQCLTGVFAPGNLQQVAHGEVGDGLHTRDWAHPEAIIFGITPSF